MSEERSTTSCWFTWGDVGGACYLEPDSLVVIYGRTTYLPVVHCARILTPHPTVELDPYDWVEPFSVVLTWEQTTCSPFGTTLEDYHPLHRAVKLVVPLGGVESTIVYE
jgi:hypothetical protein